MEKFVLLLTLVSCVAAHYSRFHTFKRGAAQPIGDIRMASIYAHNVVRSQHVNTPDLVWNAKLANDAQGYALQLANSGTFRHSGVGDGENLYVGTGSSVKPFSIAAYLWYEERNRFNYNSIFNYNFFGIGKLGHFTQMVWSNSRQVGCAGASISVGGGVKTYYVCRYSPAGNVRGKYDDFVKPPKAGFTTPNGPTFYEESAGAASGCVDANPSYCNSVSESLCNSPIFGSFNQQACNKKCGVC